MTIKTKPDYNSPKVEAIISLILLFFYNQDSMYILK